MRVFSKPSLYIKLFVFSFLIFLDGNILAKRKLAFVFGQDNPKNAVKIIDSNERKPASVSYAQLPKKEK